MKGARKIIYIIPISILLIIVDNTRKRRSLRIKKKKKFKLDIRLIKKLDKKLQYYDTLYKLKESYVIKLGVINTKKPRENNATVLWYGIFTIVITIVAGYIYSLIFKMWYIDLILALVTMYGIFSIANFILKMRLKKVQKQFPVAIKKFTDVYTTCKSIKITLNSIYKDMPKEIANVFEKLSRQLSSSYEYEEHIIEFANSLDYVWGYAFAELLIMSYEGVGDISEELLFLSSLIDEDIIVEEETSSELATIKIMFMIIEVATIVAFLFNIVANPISKDLYFYTSTGNNIIMIWALIIAFGLGTSVILDYI